MKKRTGKIYIETIKDIICDHFSTTFAELYKHNKSRDVEYKIPRQLIMVFIGEFSYLSCSQISSIFFKDHATYLHARKTIRNREIFEPSFKELMKELRDKIINRFALIDEKTDLVVYVKEEILICL